MIEFKFSDYLSPSRLLYWRRLLWKSQFYPEEKQRALQWNLLSKMLDHCFEKVPYYQRVFKQLGLQRSDFRSLDDLSLLPVIDRYTLIDFHEEFKASDFKKHKPKKIKTSGTVGALMYVYWDINSNILELLCQLRHFSWIGYRIGEPFLDIRSVVFEDSKEFKWNWKCRGLELSSDYIDSSNIERFAGFLRKYRIKLWRGYPESIDYLCRLLKSAGIEDVKPKYVNCVSVAVHSYQRRIIEQWTGIPLCDSYGIREHNCLICQCPEGGYHMASEYGITEIIKEDGTPARAGEEGRIVATGLHNKAFPLLRYDTMDFAVATDRKCSCGRKLPLIERLTGRINDFIRDTRGRLVSAPAFPMYFGENVRKAQLIQNNKHSIDLYIVPDKNYSKKTDPILINEYKKKMGFSMEVNIHHVKEVPFPRKGKKYKFAISKINKN